MEQEGKVILKEIKERRDLSQFSEAAINKNTGVYSNRHNEFWGKSVRASDFKSAKHIIESGDEEMKRALSQEFFTKNGFYRQMISYYATLLNNSGLLIPNPSPNISLQEKSVAKRYHGSIALIDSMRLPTRLREWTISVLVNGVYRGIIHTLSKKEVIILDLPLNFTRSQYYDKHGNKLVELDMQYFARISDEAVRKAALQSYPKFIADYYKAWTQDGRISSWLLLPQDRTISLELIDVTPFFLPLIPITLQYDEAVEREAEKERENIKRIMIQEMPHLNTGELVFEPDEAAIMHEGAVDMLSGDENISVMTSYGKVSVAQSNTQSSITHTALDQMSKHLYSTAGVSDQIFAPKGASALGTSVQYDLSVMMILADKMSKIISDIVTRAHGTQSLSFSYKILPVSEYNKEKYVTNALKLAQSGYSFLVPAVAQGLSQRELVDIKQLEENLLEMSSFLNPLQSSHTQTKDGAGATDEGGAPTKSLDDKSDKTVVNRESKGQTEEGASE